jgi:hypothetical protein
MCNVTTGTKLFIIIIISSSSSIVTITIAKGKIFPSTS